MRDLDGINSSNGLENEITYFNKENQEKSHGENVNIIIVTRRRLRNRKKHNVSIQAQQHRVFAHLSRFNRSKEQVSVARYSSMPELNEGIWPKPLRNRSGRGKDTIQNKNKLSPFRSKFIVNVVSEHRFEQRLNPFSYPRQTKLKVYRCEVGGEDNCCCSCNSDAMFEIMRSLYECYKKRDCTNCKCILCSHIKPEDKTKYSEKEKLLREKAMKGLPLPEGITSSEKKLINKVRTDLGVPTEPKTKEIRDKHEEASKAGKLLPLEGKTPAEKEKILKDLFDMGIPLPKGRTPSEKALIAKISGKEPSEEVSLAMAHSKQMQKAKAEGLLTPLKGKTPEDKEKILKGLAMIGLPLPEGQTPSENKLIEKVRTDLGLPIEPTNKDIRDKHEKASKAGKLLPLEGKTPEQKEKILKGLHNMGIPLPVGRTPSEKSLIAKIVASPREASKASSVVPAHSELMRKAKAEGLLTPLKGKTPKQKEKILRGLAMKGLPLPEGQSPSEIKLIKKVRTDLGVPIEPKSKAIRKKHEEAAKAGKLLPLEGKKPEKKKKILQDLHNMGIPLPIGRTPSEKALIAEVKSKKPTKALSLSLSEQMRKAKEEGLLTPLKGKTPEQKEKIVRGLAMKGLALPEAESPSEKKLIDKVRADLGLPKDPTTKSMKDKHEQAAKAGFLKPLEGKTPEQKENILKGLRDLGIPLPEGRTPSEKALIDKVKASPPSIITPSEQMRRAKVEGFLTPLKGKSPEQKEKIVKGLAMKGLPLPEAQSASEKKLIDKVRTDLGLPKDPTTKSMKDRHEKAAKAGLLQPLEGKTPAEKAKILKGLRDLGIPLPEGRTPSEKALIDKIKASPRSVIAPSEQLRRAKAEGLLTPLKGKPPEQKEKILKGLAMKGLALPEAQSPSEKKLIDKVRADLGLPKDPTTKSMKEKHEQAAKAGLLQPLEGKTLEEKAKVLKGLRDLGIPLPEGRTPSEKALIGKIKESPRTVISPSEQLRRAKAEGLLTTLKGKPPEQKEKILKGLAMKGLALPEAQSPSEKKLIDKVRADLGLPKDPTTKSMKEKHEQAAKAGLLQPLEGKTPEEKAKVLKGLRDLGIPLPEGRTPSEKALIAKVKASSRSVIALSEQLRRAKAEGLLTTLKGKPPEQQLKILKGLAMKGLALPEAQSPSEKKLIDKVRADLGLPKDPTTKSMKEKHEQAAKAGLLQPLEGKTLEEKAKVLKGLRDLGIPLPEGRTPSEKALIGKVKESPRTVISPSEQLRRAKAEGLLTTLKGKPPDQKEKILKGLAMKGLALPEAQSPSEKKLIDKVRADLGLPKDPTTKSMKEKHEQAAKAGLLQPLEGKTPEEKAKVLKGLRDLGIPLPEGRTPSEKALIAKVKASSRSVIALSERLRIAKAEGLMTALKGKTSDERETILRGLAMKGLLLPEAQSPSEKKLIDKVRADLGLPKDPTTKSMRDKHEQAAKAGLLQPLEGKATAEKTKVLRGLLDLGIPLPEGRTPSEKALISKVKALSRSVIALSERLRKAKAQGLLTTLKGKTPDEREIILRGLAMRGLPLPEGQSPSENQLIDKVRTDLGLPIEPKTKDIRDKHEIAAKAGKLLPLEGKTPAQKEKILKGLHKLGIPLPIGRTPSEKSLIAKIAASPPESSKASSVALARSERIRKAKAQGLLTPLKDKTPEDREKILRGLAMIGLPLPEAQSPSENKIIIKVRTDLGLPIEPKTKDIRAKHEKAAKSGKLLPLEGKTPEQKEKILRGLHNMGIPLPVGRTPSEKSLIDRIAASPRKPSKASSVALTHSEQMRRAEAEGLLTPLKDKSPEYKEKILRGLAMKGLPLPAAQSPSENKLIKKVRADLGLPIEPKSKDIRAKHEKAAKAGKLLPLEGKTPEEKENILKGLHNMGIPLPVGRTPSEKSLIAKIAASPREASIASSAARAHSEIMRKAKAEGLLTPLTDKTPEEKEKILRGLAMKGLPLPEGKSPSENKLIEKVRTDLGLPVEPKSKDIRAKHEKAAKAGKLLPLEGKTPEQKEKILKRLHNMDIPLPVGRTPSEKSLIAKIAASPREPSKASSVAVSHSEQMRRAEAEGLLTPLEDKSPEYKEKILRGLAMKGLPLPAALSPSESKLIEKVRTDLGLPIEPKTKDIRAKHEKAAKAGKLLPLEGKTPEKKEKILKGLHNMGIPLPIGRTPSEKSLIDRIAASPREASIASSAARALSELMRKAKAEGLLTPLTDKTPEEREKILRGLAMKGLPLPEGKSPSENELIEKVRTDLGLPIEPKTKDIRDKHEKAAKAGKLLALENKTPEQKEKILKDLHDMGIPLPIGRTPSEKSLIAKIVAGTHGPSKAASPIPSFSKQLRTAKEEGLLTPLADKAPQEREKILRGLAMKGLPLPEGTSPSENELIEKVRTDLGLPIEPKTKDIRTKHEKAAKAGKLLPLEGKTPEQKEKILRDLHDIGIPLPIGRTASEKALIEKVMAGSGKLISEEYEEIQKTTTCDRACGCDKKKIRFKHSYIKIRVTSPDISSFCDCPDICIPGVKSGVFIDSDGIKVTVASVLGTPLFTRGYNDRKTLDEFSSKTEYSYTRTERKFLKNSMGPKYKISSIESSLSSNKLRYILSSSSYFESSSPRPNSTESENIYLRCSTPLLPRMLEGPVKRCLQPLGHGGNQYPISRTNSTASSLGSIMVLKSEMSLCSTISHKLMKTVSLMSVLKSSISSTSSHYSSYQSTDDPRSSSSLDDLISSDDSIDYPVTIGERNKLRNIEAEFPKREYTILRVSETRLDFVNSEVRTNVLNSEDSILIRNHLPSNLDVSKIMRKIMTQKHFADASSIFIVVPMSEDEEEHASCSFIDSMTSHSSETETILRGTSQVDPNLALKPHSFTERDEHICRKGKKFYLKNISSNDTDTMVQHKSILSPRPIEMMKDDCCQNNRPNGIAVKLEKAVHAYGTDISTNIPCCCCTKECPKPLVAHNCSPNETCTANVIIRQKKPLSLQAISCSHVPEKRSPSAMSLPSDKPAVLGTCLLPSGKTGCCRLPDMRTPSPISLVELGSSSALKSRIPQGVKSRGCHLPDMRTPSISLVQLLSSSSALKSRVLPSKKSGCCRLPDMRTPSPMPLVQLGNSSALKSRILPSVARACGTRSLPDMRTPSARSSDLPCAALAQPSVGPSHFPHKSTGYYRLPNMPSAISSILHCPSSYTAPIPAEDPSSSDVDWFSRSLSKTFGCCYSSPSTETSATILSNTRVSCCDSHLSFDDSLHVPSHREHNMHYTRIETTTPQRNRREVLSHTIKIRRSASAHKLKISIKNHHGDDPIAIGDSTRTSPIQCRESQESYISIDFLEDNCLYEDIEGTDILPEETLIQEPWIQKSLNTKLPMESIDDEDDTSSNDKLKISKTDHGDDLIIIGDPLHTGSIQASQESFISIDFLEHNCLCEDKEGTEIIPDEIFIQEPRFQNSLDAKLPIESIDDVINTQGTNGTPTRQPRFQHSRNLKKLKDFTIVKDFENKGFTAIKKRIQHLRHETNSKVKTLKHPTNEEDYLSDDRQGTNIIMIKILSPKSKIVIYSNDEQAGLAELLKGTHIITNNMPSQEPQLQASGMSKMPINPTNGDHCLCNDIEDPNIISDEIPNKQPRLQTNRKSKILKESTVEEKVKISSITRQPQANWDSKMPMVSGTDQKTDRISRSKPRLEEQRSYELPLFSTDGDKCVCEEIEGTNKMLTQEPQLQNSGKSNMPLNPADGDHCLCEDVDEENKRSTEQQQLRIEKSQKSKKQKESAIKEVFESISVGHPDYTPHKLRNRHAPPPVNWKNVEVKNSSTKNEIQHTPKNLTTKDWFANKEFCACEEIIARNRLCTADQGQRQEGESTNSSKITKVITAIIKPISHTINKTEVNNFTINNYEIEKPTKMLTNTDCACEQQLKNPVTRENCECLNQSKGFGIQASCACQQHSKVPVIEENSEYQQQSKVLDNNELCACEEITARNRICSTGQGQQQERASTNSSNITKSITAITKSTSHTIDNTEVKNTTINYEIQQRSKNLTTKDCECEQQSKDPVTRVNCECLNQPKDFATKANCACQQHSKVPGIEENSEYQQQSKGFASHDLCACEEITARNRLCTTDQVPQKEKLSANSSKISKLVTSIRKSISHTIGKTRNGKSKKNVEAENKSVKRQSDHSIQTTPEQVLQFQEIPPNVPSEPEVINDKYPHENSCGWIDIKKLMRLRSDLTEITSGFKACKKKYRRVWEDTILEKPIAEIELDFEDAIKYYVGKNLDQFRDLLTPVESEQKTTQGAIKKAKKGGRDHSEKYKNFEKYLDCCECPYGSVPLEISYKSMTLTPEASAELAKLYPKGLKFSLGGTGLKLAPGTSRKPDRTGIGA